MIKGLHWYHLGWFATALYILIATASANGRYQLNHALAEDVWRGLERGYPRFVEFKEKKAEELDKATKERYSPKSPNTLGCVSAPTEVIFISKNKVIELDLSLPKSREDAIAVLGEPLCNLANGGDRWVIKDGSIVDVEYDPVRVNYQNADRLP
jgi:hypothetical protein